MGKGDQKSRKGKIIAGSYGKKRPRKASVPMSVNVKEQEPVKEVQSKVVAKPKNESRVAKTEAKPKAVKAKKTEE